MILALTRPALGDIVSLGRAVSRLYWLAAPKFDGYDTAYVTANIAPKEFAVFANLKYSCALVVLICIGNGLMTLSASAITVEVAKKCDELLAKAFPPRELGNPAAGSAKGSGLAAQDYFKKCLANDGNMDASPSPSGNAGQSGDKSPPPGNAGQGSDQTSPAAK
jgi:hypothetical protein